MTRKRGSHDPGQPHEPTLSTPFMPTTPEAPSWCCVRCGRGVLQLVVALPCCLFSGVFLVAAFLVRAALLCCGCASPAIDPRQLHDDPQTVRFFFDGAGWAFPFGLGVARYVQRTAPALRPSNMQIWAISAGNLAGLAMLLEQDPSDVLMEHFQATERAMLGRPLLGFLDSLGPIRAFLEAWLPDDAHVRVSGRLNVVACRWPWLGFQVISDFSSKDELVEAVLCSCSLLGFVYRPRCSTFPKWPGCMVDGAYQNLLTPVDDHVHVAVRAFAKNRPHSLTPSKGAYHPRYRLMTLPLANKLMDAAAVDAAAYEPLRRALAPFVQGHTPRAPNGYGTSDNV